MIASMTGFGRGTAQVENISATVEMRSVNNRYCEVSVRTPRNGSRYESDVQKTVKKAFARGKISVNVQFGFVGDQATAINIDLEKAKSYTALLTQLKEAAGLDDAITLDHLLQFDDVMTPAGEDEKTQKVIKKTIADAVKLAIQKMAEMRQQEGQALNDDLALRVNTIEEQLAVIEKRAPERIIEGRKRLNDKLSQFIDDDRINPERLELEIALLADKLDVTEEVVRLKSHLAMFREALTLNEPVGRKLNFLVQEINREVNTIGSKANDAVITQHSVAMKEALEQIREQVQNIE